MRTHIALAALFLAGVLSLTGCRSNPLSTAASMRVEVEVYKGPLSKTLPVQWGKLEGLVDEAADSLTTFNDAIVMAAARLGYVTGQNNDPKKAHVSIEPHYRSGEIIDQGSGSILPRIKRPDIDTRTVTKIDDTSYYDWCKSEKVKSSRTNIPNAFIGCHILSNMHDDIRVLLAELHILHHDIERHVSKESGCHIDQTLATLDGSSMPQGSADTSDCQTRRADTSTKRTPSGLDASREQVIKQVSHVAVKLKAKAFYWAETHVGVSPQNRDVRIAIAAFANLASEYSNQLESRADALQWQLGKKISAKQLPLSIYLRDAEPTDFLNLYTWNRATAPALLTDMVWHPLNAFSSNETADRVRVIERLFADHNWGKINTVYGSGQGKFAMALVKDEIGNWDLKSFESDPSELVDAYTKLTLAALKKTRKAITGGGDEWADLLRLTGNLAQGQISDDAGQSNAFNTNRLHERVIEELKTTGVDAAKKKGGLDKKLDETNGTVETRNVKAQVAKENAESVEAGDKPSTCAAQGPCNAEDTIMKAREARIGAFRAEIQVQDLSTKASTKAASTTADLVKKAVEYARNAEDTAATAEEPSGAAAKSARLFAEKAEAYTKAATEWAVYAKALVDKDRAVADLARHRMAVNAQIREILGDYTAVIGMLQEAYIPNQSPTKDKSEPLAKLR